MTEEKGKEIKNSAAQLTPRDVVTAGYKYLSDVMADQKISAVRIEELEQVEDGKFWSLVLSYDVVGEFIFEKKREYKEFKIDNEGNVVSMKIKKV